MKTTAKTTATAASSPNAANKKTASNIMKQIKIAKITLNIGAGKNEDVLKKGLKLLQKLTPQVAVKTLAKKRIPGWGLRQGLAIGCKVTIRKGTNELLHRLLAAKSNTLSVKNFDTEGNFSFGIPEYIDIQGMEYDPELKIMGLEAAVTLIRPGYRVKDRQLKTQILGKHHKISKEEAINYIREQGVKVE